MCALRSLLFSWPGNLAVVHSSRFPSAFECRPPRRRVTSLVCVGCYYCLNFNNDFDLLSGNSSSELEKAKTRMCRPRHHVTLLKIAVCTQHGYVRLIDALPLSQQELTRWSVLTDEACDALMGSKPRLVKISTLARPAAVSRQSFTGDDNNSGGGGSGGGALSSSRGRSARGMLGRLSLGGSKKNIADVFAVEPLRRDSIGGGGGSTRSLLSSSAGGSSGRAAGGMGGGQTEQHQRDALFGQREAGAGGGGETSAVGGARGGVGGTHAAASEARDLAIERGEKLENLVDRSRQLEDSAMAFGDMAKQLRKQQEDEACCVS